MIGEIIFASAILVLAALLLWRAKIDDDKFDERYGKGL